MNRKTTAVETDTASAKKTASRKVAVLKSSLARVKHKAGTANGTNERRIARQFAGRRQDGGIVLLGRSLYEVNALRQVVFEALMTGVVPAILLALASGIIFSLRMTRRLKTIHETTLRIMHGDLQERLPTQGKMGRPELCGERG
jgi:hypothetical protein